MPRRNLWILFSVAIGSLVCYQTADRNPLGRYFATVVDYVERRYVAEVDREALWQGAVHGMLEKLDDPNSQYLEPVEAAEFEEPLNQQFGGIGIQVFRDEKSKRFTVVSPIVGSPAYKAGVLAGDVIVRIDGKPTRDMEMKDLTALLRGQEGEVVRLGLEREGHQGEIDLPVTRAIVKVDSVIGDRRDANDAWDFLIAREPNIGYLRVTTFGDRTIDEITTALAQLKKQNMQGLILDLRNDHGGLLSAAVEMCDLFVPAGQTIVSLKGRDAEEDRSYVATGGTKYLNVPMVVLINEESASASEIVAACLQDTGRAVVIGERSFGKGTVQHVFELPGNRGALKLTTAEYWRPSNKNIHRRKDAKETDEWGVQPSAGFEVKMTLDQWRDWAKWRSDRDVVRPRGANGGDAVDNGNTFDADPPLMKALEYLREKLASNAT